MERSLCSRNGAGNDSVVNVRDDEVQDDDDEFFHGTAFETVRGEDKENRGTTDTAKYGVDYDKMDKGSQQRPPPHPSDLPQSTSLRYPSNLSKISESPDEFSFSFKRGENAIQQFNRDHEELRRQNHLRLPSVSFHTSHYSMKHSWEESALRLQNATHCSFARPELDLSTVDVTDTKQQLSSIKNQTVANSFSAFPNTSASNHSAAASPQFLSGSRHCIYFGFCRLDFESEQTLILRNRHPRGERVQIKCEWTVNTTDQPHFRILYPRETAQNREHTQILGSEQAAKVIIGFTPSDCAYYKNFLRIECKSRDETREYYFLVHGYGGRAVVEPTMEDRSANLCFSTNGQFQLIVRSISKFRFWLKNLGKRSAFVSLLFYYPNGIELARHEIAVNMHDLLLSWEGLPEPPIKMIEARFMGTKCSASSSQSVASNSPDSAREIALRIAIIWGEEKQRQRLKKFENKEMDKLRGELKNFGQNFTMKRIFDGDNSCDTDLQRITEEEFYCFDRQTRITFINVIEQSQAAVSVERCSSAGSLVPSLQQRVGSALSVVSGGTEGRRELRAHQTIVEMDPDNTLTVGGAKMLEDDTLT
ncbi:hypothetical protein niasHS_000541 [Heterodera schachtii]|uniref:Uncharacterized protein n=1 Tax=Heterodera schachtii TaxID=97005 RepID=A0ABD2K4J4_HETSC